MHSGFLPMHSCFPILPCYFHFLPIMQRIQNKYARVVRPPSRIQHFITAQPSSHVVVIFSLVSSHSSPSRHAREKTNMVDSSLMGLCKDGRQSKHIIPLSTIFELISFFVLWLLQNVKTQAIKPTSWGRKHISTHAK